MERLPRVISPESSVTLVSYLCHNSGHWKGHFVPGTLGHLEFLPRNRCSRDRGSSTVNIGSSPTTGVEQEEIYIFFQIKPTGHAFLFRGKSVLSLCCDLSLRALRYTNILLNNPNRHPSPPPTLEESDDPPDDDHDFSGFLTGEGGGKRGGEGEEEPR